MVVAQLMTDSSGKGRVMRVLVLGANGFVGRHLTNTLRKAGYRVAGGLRKPKQSEDIQIDYCKDNTKEVWLPRLANVDAVINAVGVLRDNINQPMKQILEQTPLALFSACQERGIKRIVQISALGIDKGIETPYFQTRRAPEAYLAGLPEPGRWLILRPSIIYGKDGASARLFKTQAVLPVHTLPDGGRQRLQPVHIDDICTAVIHWLVDPGAQNQIIDAVGLEATDLRGMLDSYRHQQGKSKALHVTIPSWLVGLFAQVGDLIPSSPLCSDTLTMLNAGNTGDASAFMKLLGRTPRSYRQFIGQGRDYESP